MIRLVLQKYKTENEKYRTPKIQMDGNKRLSVDFATIEERKVRVVTCLYELFSVDNLLCMVLEHVFVCLPLAPLVSGTDKAKRDLAQSVRRIDLLEVFILDVFFIGLLFDYVTVVLCNQGSLGCKC